MAAPRDRQALKEQRAQVHGPQFAWSHRLAERIQTKASTQRAVLVGSCAALATRSGGASKIRRAVENIRLEFKLLVPNKDETLKKLSSFANTYGGFVVIGAKANSADGRIEELPGVDLEPGYRQKVVQWCFDGASPPLVVGVSDPIPTPSGNGKVCYVVYTAESDVAPHFLNGRKGIWVRTDEFSERFEAHLADENELRHLFDRRS